jgi:ribonuclease H2 subunit B
MIIKLLRIKVDYFAVEERWNCFDHLVRGLGRDGLSGSAVSLELLQGTLGVPAGVRVMLTIPAARSKASVEHLAQWLPPSLTADLLSTYE